MKTNIGYQSNFYHNFKRVIEFICLLNVELFMFFFMIFHNMKKVPTDQLIQDKLCLQKYKLSPKYCIDLPHMTSGDDYLNKKSLILADLTHYSFYTTLITTIPSLLAALFVGSWTDKYLGAKRAMMMASSTAAISEALISLANAYFYDHSASLVLLSSVPGCLTGGTLTVFTAFWSYIASTTPPKLRAMRMMIAEILMNTASPLGTFIGGKLLNQKPIMKYGQLHNYTLIFTFGCLTNLMALIWLLIKINEKKDIKEFIIRFEKNNKIEERDEPVVCEKQKQFDENKGIHPLKLLFNFGNIRDMIRTCCKRRSNYVRLQIWLLFLAMICYVLTHSGVHSFLYSFVQEVYDWNSETYSNATAIGNALNALATLIVAPILIKIIKAKDTTLAMIGFGAYFSQNIIRGVVLNEIGYYISFVTGALGSISSVGIRTHFSKIVEPKELGKVFSLMSAIDSLAPLIASAVFTNLFNATMDTIPGISFIIIGGLLLIPFYVIFWIDLFTVLPDFSKTQINNNKSDVNENNCEFFSKTVTKM